MAKGEYIAFPMIVDNVVLGLISTTADIVDRFQIPSAVIDLELPGVNRKRKAHERRIYENAAATAPSGTTTNVKEVIKVYMPDKTRHNSGKKIKLDTGLRSVPVSENNQSAENAGSIRYATVNFPHGCSNYQVARWITVNIPEGRRPRHFITPSGAKRRTNVAAAPGQTAGETETPTTP